jgi:hypothetical protein
MDSFNGEGDSLAACDWRIHDARAKGGATKQREI